MKITFMHDNDICGQRKLYLHAWKLEIAMHENDIFMHGSNFLINKIDTSSQAKIFTVSVSGREVPEPADRRLQTRRMP